MNKLEKLCKNKRVALIGPSPHMHGLGFGEYIDDFDLVLRVNEIIPKGFEIDYGSRTDIVFLNFGNESMPLFNKMVEENKEIVNSIRLFVAPRNSLHVTPFHLNQFESKENVHNNFRKLNIVNDFYHIGDEKNESIENKIGCHTTIGTIVMSLLSEIEYKELFISGFSFFTTIFRYNKVKSDYEKNFDSKIKGSPGHNIDQEIIYLQQLFNDYQNIKYDHYFENIILKNNYPIRKDLNWLLDFSKFLKLKKGF